MKRSDAIPPSAAGVLVSLARLPQCIVLPNWPSAEHFKLQLSEVVMNVYNGLLVAKLTAAGGWFNATRCEGLVMGCAAPAAPAPTAVAQFVHLDNAAATALLATWTAQARMLGL